MTNARIMRNTCASALRKETSMRAERPKHDAIVSKNENKRKIFSAVLAASIRTFFVARIVGSNDIERSASTSHRIASILITSHKNNHHDVVP